MTTQPDLLCLVGAQSFNLHLLVQLLESTCHLVVTRDDEANVSAWQGHSVFPPLGKLLCRPIARVSRVWGCYSSWMLLEKGGSVAKIYLVGLHTQVHNPLSTMLKSKKS